TPNTPTSTKGGLNGVKVENSTNTPYVEKGAINSNSDPRVNLKPGESNVGTTTNTDANHWENKGQLQNYSNDNAPQQSNNNNPGSINKYGSENHPQDTRPFVKQNDNNEPSDWHTAPPDRWSNKPNVTQQQPNQNDWRDQQRNNNNNVQQQNNGSSNRTER